MSHLPNDTQIGAMLRDLLGRDVECKEKKAKLTGNVLYAHYKSQGGEEEALWLWDFASGVSVGAALTMLSPEESAAAIRKGVADEMLLENFREVCNILVRLLNDDGDQALFLDEVGSADAKKGPIADKVKTMTHSSSFELKFQGYGGGFSVLNRK